MKFKASLDKLTAITTIVITLLFIAIIISQIYLAYPSTKWIAIITSAILIIIYLFVFFYKPLYYKLNYHQLIIHRYIGDVILKKREIVSVELLDKSMLRGAVRTFGVGGLFGYFGKFYNFNIGVMTWFTTRRNNYVLIITTNNKKIIITPDFPDQFITEYHK